MKGTSFYSSSPAMQLQRIQDSEYLKYITYKMLSPATYFLFMFEIPKWA